MSTAVVEPETVDVESETEEPVLHQRCPSCSTANFSLCGMYCNHDDIPTGRCPKHPPADRICPDCKSVDVCPRCGQWVIVRG